MASQDYRLKIKQIADKKLAPLKKGLTKAQADQIGAACVEEMKRQISVGISPLGKGGRFPAYKRAGDPKGYPKNVQRDFPAKRDRPVNLELSGDMLADLIFKSVKGKTGGYDIKIGYKSKASQIKERGHREGAGGQPKRPTIPQAPSGFNQSIRVLLRRMVKDFLVKALKKG